jgi:hypothetical protein
MVVVEARTGFHVYYGMPRITIEKGMLRAYNIVRAEASTKRMPHAMDS